MRTESDICRNFCTWQERLSSHCMPPSSWPVWDSLVARQGKSWSSLMQCLTVLAVHKSPSTTGTCGLTFALSKFVQETQKLLLPVGSGMHMRGERRHSHKVWIIPHPLLPPDQIMWQFSVIQRWRTTVQKESFYVKVSFYNDVVQLPFNYRCLQEM